MSFEAQCARHGLSFVTPISFQPPFVAGRDRDDIVALVVDGRADAVLLDRPLQFERIDSEQRGGRLAARASWRRFYSGTRVASPHEAKLATFSLGLRFRSSYSFGKTQSDSRDHRGPKSACGKPQIARLMSNMFRAQPQVQTTN